MIPEIILRVSAWNEPTLKFVTEYLSAAMQRSAGYELLPASLIKVIVSDDYYNAYKEIAENWELKAPLIKESEMISVIKLCFNQDKQNPEHILLLDAGIFHPEGNVEDNINTILLQEAASDVLPPEIREWQGAVDQWPLDRGAQIVFNKCWIAIYPHFRLWPEGRAEQVPPVSAKAILAVFRRTVKRIHLRYQSDNDFDEFIMGFYNALQDLLTRFTDISVYKVDTDEFMGFQPVMVRFIQSMFDTSVNIIKGETVSIDFIKPVMKEIAGLCFVDLMESGGMKITEDPKKLFPDLIDTHDRIVAFVDILGFSKMIEKFDKERNHTLLTDLKDSMDTAMEKMKDTFKYGSSELEFRMFSDCLCISTPYFDNDVDFGYQFTSMMLGLKTYQHMMLMKGYMVRGGITFGPYYSDENIIFSGAMVEAYHFETNGTTKGSKQDYRPPRIIVSPKIMEKLPQTVIHSAFFHFYADSLITDEDGETFINPVYNIGAAGKVYDDILKTFDEENEKDYGIQEILKSSINLITAFMDPNAESITYRHIISVMEAKKAEQEDQRITDKYDWMMGFIHSMKARFSTGKFSVHPIKFKEIITDWTKYERE